MTTSPTTPDTSPDTTHKINPLKRARIDLGLSQAELAKRVGVSPGAILKYEQGLYQEPSHKILRTIAAVGESQDQFMNLAVLTNEYHKWRESHQATHHWLFQPIRYLPIVSLSDHPFRLFRQRVGEGYSVQGFAVVLAVHPATIQNYDSGKNRTMPSIIKSALLNSGCRASVVDELDQLGERYFDLHH
jgi:transcriptional regulator with XRE-family HTH domain